jgi:hypothetical protein
VVWGVPGFGQTQGPVMAAVNSWYAAGGQARTSYEKPQKGQEPSYAADTAQQRPQPVNKPKACRLRKFKVARGFQRLFAQRNLSRSVNSHQGTSCCPIMTEQTPVPRSILRGHKVQVYAATFIRRNKRLVTGDADGFVIVWDLTILRPRAVWKAHEKAILGIREWGTDRLITLVVPSVFGHENTGGAETF